MAISPRIRNFLEENGVRFECYSHPPAFTAQETAAAQHVPGQLLAKTVIVKLDGRLAMAVLPAPYNVDFQRLGAAAGAERAELASEQEFAHLFPDCDLGAMAPFGNLYGLSVYVDETLTRDKEIYFNAGSHTESIKMSYEDFARLVQPKVSSFAVRAA